MSLWPVVWTLATSVGAWAEEGVILTAMVPPPEIFTKEVLTVDGALILARFETLLGFGIDLVRIPRRDQQIARQDTEVDA